MSFHVSPASRFGNAVGVAFRWIVVLTAVLVSIVVVPLVELASELVGLLRRAFAPRR